VFGLTLPTAALAQTVSFVSATDFAAGTEPVSVAMGDLHGDWVPDLATANAGNIVCDPQCHLGPGAASVLLGKGDGTFRAPLTLRDRQASPIRRRRRLQR